MIAVETAARVAQRLVITGLKPRCELKGETASVPASSLALCSSQNFVHCLRSEEILSQSGVRHVHRDCIYYRSSAAKRVATCGRMSASGSQAPQVSVDSPLDHRNRILLKLRERRTEFSLSTRHIT